jgi:hypothetical protein
MYFPRNWKFGTALSKLRNFGVGGLNPYPLGTPLVTGVLSRTAVDKKQQIYCGDSLEVLPIWSAWLTVWECRVWLGKQVTKLNITVT